MASKTTPYEICLRSVDREPGGTPSDYVVRLSGSHARTPVAQVGVATLELPLTQPSVDARRGRFYWSEGVCLAGPDAAVLRGTVGGAAFAAQLPPTMAAVTVTVVSTSDAQDQTQDQTQTLLFETAAPHGVPAGAGADVLGRLWLEDVFLDGRRSLEGAFHVSATTFKLVVPVGGASALIDPSNAAPTNGWLRADLYGDPATLAAVATLALREAIGAEAAALLRPELAYDAARGRHALVVRRGGPDVALLATPLLTDTLGMRPGPVREEDAGGTLSLAGAAPPPYVRGVCVAGNHSPDSLAAAVTLATQRQLLPQPEALAFALAGATGPPLQATLPAGAYRDPQGFAGALQAAMNAAAAGGATFAVAAEPCDPPPPPPPLSASTPPPPAAWPPAACAFHRLTVRCVEGRDFALHLQEGAAAPPEGHAPMDAERLGFEAVCHAGASAYCGAPVLSAPGYGVTCTTDEHGRYVFASAVAARSSCAATVTSHDADASLSSITLTAAQAGCPSAVAAGMALSVQAAGVARPFVALVTAFDFVAATGQAVVSVQPSPRGAALLRDALGSAPPGHACVVSLVGTPSVNVHLERGLPRRLRRETLGFPEDRTYVASADGAVRPCVAGWRASPLVAPGLPYVGPEPYLLMRVGLVQGGSTTVRARCGASTVTVTGKLSTGAAHLVQQRHTPLEVTCAGVERIDRVRIEFLNPDGTHYDFSGREHTLALVLAVPENGVQMALQ